MNENHRHEYDDITRLEQAIRDKQPTGNRTIDRLVSTVPRPDASRRDALEAYLVAQLTPESELKESEYMDRPVEMKRKNKPKPKRRGRNIGIAAIVSIGLTMITLAGAFLFPRPTLHQFGTIYISPERTPELHPALLIATRLSAEATRDAGTASANDITESDRMLLTATAIIREVTLTQIAPILTAIEQENALQARLNGDQKTATALIQEVTQVYVDQTAQASGLSREMLTATAIIHQATQIVSDATAQAISANQPKSDDEMTATALILEVTQVYIEQTATMQRILGSPVPLATPTPELRFGGVRPTVRIPMTRLIPYDNRTVSPALFTDNKRLVLLVELRLTQHASILGEVESNDRDSIERPIIAASARIVDVYQAEIGDIPYIEVGVDSSEYPLLKWFVDSTNVQFLFIASR